VASQGRQNTIVFLVYIYIIHTVFFSLDVISKSVKTSGILNCLLRKVFFHNLELNILKSRLVFPN